MAYPTYRVYRLYDTHIIIMSDSYSCILMQNNYYVHTCVDIVMTIEYVHEHLSTAISQEVQDCTLKG